MRWGLFSAAAVALGLTPSVSLAQAPRSVAPQAAPKAWLDYAAMVSEQVQARLESDDPAAQRLRDYLNQLPGADTPDGVRLKLAFWIDADGVVTRVDVPLFAHPEPGADLNAILVGQKLSEAPPKDMILPLRLTVQFEPKDEPKPRPQAWNSPWAGAAGAIRIGYGASTKGDRTACATREAPRPGGVEPTNRT